VGDFNTPHDQKIGHPDKKINKVLDLNHAIVQMDQADVYRIFHPTSAQYTFFSAAHGTFSKIDHIMGTRQASANIRK
jgi:exonuclease III